jgi:hypothetical protein
MLIRYCFILLSVFCSYVALAQVTTEHFQQLASARRAAGSPHVALFTPSATTTFSKARFRAGAQPSASTVNREALARVVREKPSFLSFRLPTAAGEKTVELVPSRVFMPGAKLIVATANGTEERPVNAQALFYQGFLNDDPNSAVAVSIQNGTVSGLIADQTGNYSLSKSPTQTDDYLFYADEAILTDEKPQPACHTDAGNVPVSTADLTPPKTAKGARATPGCKVVGVYVEVDFDLYQKVGGTVALAEAYVANLFNQVVMIYNREEIAMRVAGIKVWTAADPYVSAATSGSALTAFRQYQRDNPPAVANQLQHLLTGRAIGGGQAYSNVLCTGANERAGVTPVRATFNTYPVYSETVLLVTHELGHSIGSPHTHDCTWPGGPIDNCASSVDNGPCTPGPAPAAGGGTIMSYCYLTAVKVNLANGFGPLPGNLIRTRFAQACANLPAMTDPPTNLAVRTVWPTRASLWWASDAGSTQYTVQYRPTAGGNWTTLGPFTGPQADLSGLQLNTTYTWKVTGDCANGYSAESTFTTAGAVYCTPIHSGTNACSNNIGLKTVRLNGTALSTNTGCLPFYTYYAAPIGQLTKAAPNPFVVDLRTYTNQQHLTIWIDYNNNYEFDASETVFASTALLSTTIVNAINVPANVPPGTYRMRLRTQWGGNTITDPCGDVGWGEAEDYQVTVQDAALPVNLLDFTARAEGRQVRLAWQTAQEQNNRQFDVERSRDLIAWQTIATVDGSGTTEARRTYAVTDPSPPRGIVYYRLRQTDHNGQSTTYRPQAIVMEVNPSLELYPTPVDKTLSVIGIESEVQLSLCDVSGRVYQQYVLTQNTTLDVSGLPSGVYLVRMQDQTSQRTQRIVVQH